MSETQRVCKHCQAIELSPFHDWPAEGTHKFAAVAEPVSTGEPGPRCPKCRSSVVLRHGHVGAPFCGVQCPKCLPKGTWWINSAKDLSQFFTSAPQPVSGDAPKVEEIAAKVEEYIFAEYKRMQLPDYPSNWSYARMQEIIQASLRPYFPPSPAHFSDCDYDCSCGWKKDPDSHLGAVRD